MRTFFRERGRLVASIAAALLLIALAFFASDRFLPAETPAGLRYEYDREGRIVRLAAPDGRVALYLYDAAGQLVEVSYRRPGGLTGWAYPAGGEVRFAYDPAGNRSGVEDGTGTTRYAYDDLGRPAEVTAPDGAKLAYAYDPWGRLHRLTYPDGERIEYEHNLFGQPTRLSAGRSEIGYDYQGSANRVVRRLPNRVQTVFQHASSGRLAAIEHRKADGSLLASFHYVHDPAGRVREVEERTPRGAARTQYEYDLLGRLIRVTGPDGSRTSYQYDAEGNRTTESGPSGTLRYEYDAAGRLTRAGEVSFAYDAAGRLVSRQGGGRSAEYEYDAEGNLVEVRTGKGTVRYAYDGEGLRVERELDGEAVRYLHHRFTPLPQVLAERDAEGRLLRRYLLGSSRLAQSGPDGRTVYLLEDHLGSTRCVVDAVGNVLARYAYSPFGAPRLVEGSEQTAFLFAGEEWDAAAGLLYLRARYYDPETGRFLSPDPLDGRPDDPQSYNQYAYAANDPVNRTDPTGLQPGWPPPPPPPSYYDPNRQPLFLRRPSWQLFQPPPRPPLFYDPVTDGYSRPPSRPLPDPPRPVQSETERILLGVSQGGLAIGSVLSGGGLGIALGLGAGTITFYQAAHYSPETLHLQVFKSVLELPLGSTAGAATVGLSFVLENPQESVEGAAYIASWHRRAMGEVLTIPAAVQSAARNILETQRTRDPLDYAAELAPFLAGSLDRTRNIFFPPPPGGGGGGLPLVGGVYLDQTAKVIGELGAIRGAIYDAESGRLVLVGDRQTALPPMRPEYLAAALRAVYSESPHEPGMTIDPHPQDPHAPVMLVIFFGNTENTRLGWVMFEADRVMKGYSVGRDNLTREPVRSRIPGYLSVTAMGLADPRSDNGLWSRFWLVPEPVTARLSGDGHGILFDPIRLRVKTETMRWAGGRLVPAGEGTRDAHAEAFAEHFTAHYDEYAKEQPVYAELKQVTAAVALAKWLKESGVPIDWSFVRLFGRPYPTPTTTPTAYTEEAKTWTEGLAVRTLKIFSFGGVEMTPRLQPRKDPEGKAFRDSVAAAWAKARREGKDAFAVQLGGREHRAVALPGLEQREVASYDLAETDLPGAAARLPQLPGVVRSYNSLHNEPTELGHSWSLLLPRLEFEAVGGKGESRYLSVEGDPAPQVLVQRFLLTNSFGLGQVRFREPEVDQALGRIGFKPEGSTAFRGIYPEGEGVYRLFFTNGDQALFDDGGRLRALLTPKARAIYEYDEAGRLAALRYTSETDPGDRLEVLYAWNGQGRLASMTSGGETASYRYDRAGNLSQVRSPRGVTGYRYDARRLLTAVSLAGRTVVENQYDAAGRLINQRDFRRRTLTQKVELAPDGGKIVTIGQGGRTRQRHYDARLRLTKEEGPAGGAWSYSYQEGRLSAIDAVLAGGGKARVELDERGKVKTALDPRGVRTELRYHPTGQPAEILVNGRRQAAYAYDAAGRLAGVAHDGGWTESFLWDESGRLAGYRRGGLGGRTHEARFAYGTNGLAAVESPSLGRIEIEAAQDGQPSLEFGDRSILFHHVTGGQTRLLYGSTGLLEQVEDPLGGRTSFLYNRQRLPREVKLPGGACREYTYDSAGRLAERRSCGKENPRS